MLTDFSWKILMQFANKISLNPSSSNKAPLVPSEIKCSSYLEARLKNPYILEYQGQ